uniref:Uncharacterized protein n=1 Tax=Solanum lycopersicum TaxID=4081 RepID=A0A3Q7EQM9_SOLLC
MVKGKNGKLNKKKPLANGGSFKNDFGNREVWGKVCLQSILQYYSGFIVVRNLDYNSRNRCLTLFLTAANGYKTKISSERHDLLFSFGIFCHQFLIPKPALVLLLYKSIKQPLMPLYKIR